MSRSIGDLLPDVRINAAGCPEFLALHALTRSLGEFLDRSEAWREWTAVRPVTAIVSGLTSWPNHLGQVTQRWARIKRIDAMQWHPTGDVVKFQTQSQMQELDPEWRTREGTQVRYWTTEGEAAAADVDEVSGHQVRVYPTPSTNVDDTYGLRARVVVVTDAVADFDRDDFDAQIPTVPDRIFYAFRNGLVAGALATLFLMPRKDWTDQKLAGLYGGQFEAAVARAKSRADADFGNAMYTTGYGGI